MNRPPLQRLNWQGAHPITGKQELLLHQASSSDGQLLCFSGKFTSGQDTIRFQYNPPPTPQCRNLPALFSWLQKSSIFITHTEQNEVCASSRQPPGQSTAAGGSHHLSNTACQEHSDERPKQQVSLALLERQLRITPLTP